MQYYQQAELYLAQGKLASAMAACKQALEIEPNFPHTCKTLGNILQRMGEIDQAKEWYIKALNLQPNWAEVYANLGSIYAQQQQWELAIESYKEAIGIKPNIAGFYRNLGKIWQGVGKIELARDCQEQAYSLEAQYPTALEYLKQGKRLLKLGEIEAAIAQFQSAIEFNPCLAGAYQNLGDISLKTKDFNEAINYYQKAIELKHDLWAVHHKLGKIFQEIGELDAAISNFRLSLEINPNFPWSYKNLGDILFQQGKLDAAHEHYQNLIKIQPDIWDVHRKLSEILLHQGKLDEAIFRCIKVIEINPKLPWSYHTLAAAFAEQQKWDEAVAFYDRAVQQQPDNNWLQNKLVNALEKLASQKPELAINYYQKLVKIQPKNGNLQSKLAYLLKDQEKWDEAVEAFGLAIEIKPNSSWLHFSLGEALTQLKRWDEAIIAYRHAVELKPNSHSFHRKLADVLQEKGLLEAAISSYQTAIEINPKSCWHYAALGNAYIQQQNFSEAIPCLIQALKMRPDYYDVHKKIEYILKKIGRKEAAQLWKSQQKLPHNWLRKFFNLTEDWETTSESSQNNITRINIYSNTQFNLLASETIEPKNHHNFPDKKANSAAAFVVVIPEGRGCVDLAASAVITSDNKLVRDISTGFAEVIISSAELPPIHYIDGTVAFLSAKWGGFMYFHWMFDVVARIDLLRRTNLVIDKFVFTRCDKKFQIETITALGIKQSQLIESRFFPHIKAQKLVVPSSYKSQKGNLRVSKWGCEFLRNLFLNSETIKKSSSKPERIYISRKLSSWRRVINEEEVVNILEKFGFISLTLESMSIAEQALYMAAAKVIVAPHGGGLTNLVFCCPGTKVIEIFSPKYITNFYWEISNLCGLSHYYLIGENFEDNNSNKIPWKPDIIVNLTKLQKILKFAEVK